VSINELKYGEDGFPVRARKLITNRQTFCIEVTGEAFRQLSPFVVGGRIADPAKLGLKPKLQPLLLVLMLADAQGQAVSLGEEEERMLVWVGAMQA
jgi:hypothetical protein